MYQYKFEIRNEFRLYVYYYFYSVQLSKFRHFSFFVTSQEKHKNEDISIIQLLHFLCLAYSYFMIMNITNCQVKYVCIIINIS